MGCSGGGHRTAVGLSSGRCKRCGCLDCHHASLLVRCHAPQYRHLYVLSCAGAESPSVILCAAVAFASRSLNTFVSRIRHMSSVGLALYRPFPKKSWSYGILQSSRNLIGPYVNPTTQL